MTTAALTGGPSVGKSSVLRELSSRGYTTMPEAARLIIDEEISEGREPEDFVGSEGFKNRVAARQRDIYERAPDDEVVFFDRSFVDSIAYCRYRGQDLPGWLLGAAKECVDYAFILEPLEYQDDYARIEDEEEARETHETIRETYEDLGINLHSVPVMPIPKRANMIERYTRSGPPAIH